MVNDLRTFEKKVWILFWVGGSVLLMLTRSCWLISCFCLLHPCWFSVYKFHSWERSIEHPRNLSIPSSIKFIGIKLFRIFPNSPFNTYRVCGNVLSFIPDTRHYILSLSLSLVIEEFINFINIFNELTCEFLDFFLWFVHFLFGWFSQLITSFLSLICSFSRFSKWKFRSFILNL